MVNAHHHYKQISDYLKGGSSFDLEIDVRVEHEILGTGGGLKNTSDFWDDEPFIVINGDILTDIELGPAYEHHKKSGALTTLILHDCEPFNQIQTGINGAITDIAQKNMMGRLAFTGIHIMEPGLLSHIPEGKYSDIIDCYRRLIHPGNLISAYYSQGHYWRDIGTVSSYKRANRELLNEEVISLDSDCHVDPSVRLEEWAILGKKSHIERDVEIRSSILWEGVRVRAGIKIIDSIVTSFRVVDRDLIGEIY